MKLHAEFLTKNGKKEFAVLPYKEFIVLREMLADAEDLLDLRTAKKKEAGRRGLSLEEAKKRTYASFFDWPGKPIKELGLVKEWLKSMESAGDGVYTSPRSGPPNKAPDCIVSDKKKKNVAVELCELVCQKTIEKNQKTKKENQKKMGVYRDWLFEEAVNEIQKILKKKNERKYYGGPYSKTVVLIHTDEPIICGEHNDYKNRLSAQKFVRPQQVDEAFLLFSYDPGMERCPYIKLAFK